MQFNLLVQLLHRLGFRPNTAHAIGVFTKALTELEQVVEIEAAETNKQKAIQQKANVAEHASRARSFEAAKMAERIRDLVA